MRGASIVCRAEEGTKDPGTVSYTGSWLGYVWPPGNVRTCSLEAGIATTLVWEVHNGLLLSSKAAAC